MVSAVMAGCAILLCIGNLMIVNALQENSFNNAVLHIICAAAVALAVFFCGTKRLLKSAPYLMTAEVILLLLCPFFGYNINGATRWLSVGSFRFAPALLAMPILCLFWAYIKEKSENGISKKISLFSPIAIW